MLAWVHNFSIWISYLIILTCFIGISVSLAIFLRPLLRVLIGKHPDRNEVIDPILGYMGLIFGILIGSLAITSFQNQTAAQDAAMKEASLIASLYRNFSLYPEPKRSDLRTSLSEFTLYIIEEAIPAKRQGIIPTGGVERITKMQQALGEFEPVTKGQELLYAETLENFRELVQARRIRLFSAEGSIPDFLWITLLVGWLLSLLLLFMLNASFGIQITLSVILSAAMATLVCLIAAMDYPFRGDMSVSDGFYRIVYQQLMITNQ